MFYSILSQYRSLSQNMHSAYRGRFVAVSYIASLATFYIILEPITQDHCCLSGPNLKTVYSVVVRFYDTSCSKPLPNRENTTMHPQNRAIGLYVALKGFAKSAALGMETV